MRGKMTKALVLLSGGMDSTTLLGHCLESGMSVEAMNIFYGQRHKKEVDAALNVVDYYGVDLINVDLSSILPLFAGSSLTDNIEVPEGNYKEESMKKTVVPNRNMLLISVAGAYAVSRKFDAVYIGAHAGDHDIYPDCRDYFIESCSKTLQVGNYHLVRLVAPFIYFDKSDIVKKGLELKVPYELTWTCYKGGDKACGKCGSCNERLEAFEKNGVEDPLEYENG